MPEPVEPTVTEPVIEPSMPSFTLPEGHWAEDDSHYEGMDAETKTAAQKLAGRFDSPSKAMAAHLSGHQMRGRSIVLPKADATPEEKTEVYRKIYAKMGCPDDKNNYESLAPEDIPKGFELSDERMTELRDIAHKGGMNQETFKALLSKHMEVVVGLRQQFEAEKQAVADEQQKLEAADWDKAMSALKKEWGADFEGRIEKAKKWAESRWKDKLTRMRFCYEQHIKDFAEGKMMEGSGHGQPVKTVFDSHEGE